MSGINPQPPPPPPESEMSSVVHRNIRTLVALRQREEQKRTISDRIAVSVTRFAGSMWCVYFHALWFGGWLAWNSGLVPGVKPFDPFPFSMLAMIAAVEAIFLSTFILISQNRIQRQADRRAELDLQISLLTEHELTRAVTLLDSVAQKVGATRPPAEELEEIKKDIAPERVIEEMERVEGQPSARPQSHKGDGS